MVACLTPSNVAARHGERKVSKHQELSGRVKWFNDAKGFGFVVADETGPEILIHINVLKDFGYDSVDAGAAIVLLAQESKRGLQAVKILSIEDSDSPPKERRREFTENPVEIDSESFRPARIKWFDKVRGFGFANIFGNPEDIFIHMEVLRQGGIVDLQPGEAISIRVTDGPRGKVAAEIRAWDVANKY